MSTTLEAQVKAEVNRLFPPNTKLIWVKNYLGTINEAHDCALVLGFDGYHCKGYLSYNSSNEQYMLDGSIENDELEMVQRFNGLPNGYINGRLIANGLTLNIETIGTESVAFGTFTSKKEFSAKGLNENYISNDVEKIIEFPKNMDETFITWLKDKSLAWRTEIDQRINPENENKISKGLIYNRIFFENDKVINGKLFFENTWSDTVEEIPFNFDLQKGKNLKMEDLFVKNKQLRGVVKEQMMKAANDEGKFKHSGYRLWLLKQKISAFSLEQEGVSFYTPYDKIFGEEHVFISYALLKPYLKKNTTLKALQSK